MLFVLSTDIACKTGIKFYVTHRVAAETKIKFKVGAVANEIFVFVARVSAPFHGLRCVRNHVWLVLCAFYVVLLPCLHFRQQEPAKEIKGFDEQTNQSRSKGAASTFGERRRRWSTAAILLCAQRNGTVQ